MSLADNAFNLLAYLTARKGGEVGEAAILEATKMSHGSFVAARRNLVECNLITYTPRGGNRPPQYVVMPPKAGAKKIDAKKYAISTPKYATWKAKSVNKQGKNVRSTQTNALPMVQVVPQLPRVTGDFSSRDDWEAALTDALGECIDIDYAGDFCSVYSHAHDQSDQYQITALTGGSITVD